MPVPAHKKRRTAFLMPGGSEKSSRSGFALEKSLINQQVCRNRDSRTKNPEPRVPRRREKRVPSMKKSVILLTCMFAVTAAGAWWTPASAQVSLQNNQDDKSLTRRTDDEKKTDAEIDRQYRATLRRSGANAAAKSDPWGSVRSDKQSGQSAPRR
jgi:hypothetical protein